MIYLLMWPFLYSQGDIFAECIHREHWPESGCVKTVVRTSQWTTFCGHAGTEAGRPS